MSDGQTELVWLAVIIAAGVVGGLLIARRYPGSRMRGAFALWLPVPFVVLAVILASYDDPPGSNAAENFEMSFVFVSLLIVIPWLLANLVGGLIGRGMRRRRGMPPRSGPARDGPPLVAAELPDWNHHDQPSLTLDQLSARMRLIAARARIEARLLPHVGPITGGWGTFIDRDEFDYIYCELERGGAVFDHRVVVADQLMYLIFQDRAYAMAATHMAHNPTKPERYQGLLADKQHEILAAIDPLWGNQFAHERALEAGR